MGSPGQCSPFGLLFPFLCDIHPIHTVQVQNTAFSVFRLRLEPKLILSTDSEVEVIISIRERGSAS